MRGEKSVAQFMNCTGTEETLESLDWKLERVSAEKVEGKELVQGIKIRAMGTCIITHCFSPGWIGTGPSSSSGTV